MKPSEIISLARRQTGCTEDIVTVEEAYRFLNFIIEDFGAEIRLSDSGYGLKSRTIPLVAGQSTYSYQDDEDASTGTFAIDKVVKVGILEGTGYREIPVRFVSEIDINDTLASGQPEMCFFDGTNLILTPTPKENGQMIVYGYEKNFEITSTTADTENKMWIPSRWHHIIVEGLKYWMYGNMGVGFDVARTNARNFYDSEKLKAIAQLTDRGQIAEEGGDIYLNHLA